MSHTNTMPIKFVGSPSLNGQKLSILEDWYHSALKDMDISTTSDENYYHGGMADAFSDALKLLYNMTTKSIVTAEVVVDAVKNESGSSGGFRLKRKLIILGLGVGVYALWNYDKITTTLKADNERLRAQVRENARVKKPQDERKGNPTVTN